MATALSGLPLKGRTPWAQAKPHSVTALAEVEFQERARHALAQHPLGCLLDSAGPLGPRARRAFLSVDIRGLILQQDEHFLWRADPDGPDVAIDAATFDAWLDDFQTWGCGPCGPMLFPLLTYEAFNPWIEPQSPHPLWREPQAVWLLAGSVEIYDRQTGLLHYREGDLAPLSFHAASLDRTPRAGWRETETQYFDKIQQVQRHIYDGVYYQANLSQRFLTPTTRTPLDIYQDLRARNPSPFMGVFRLGPTWVLSGSPERLVAQSDRHLSARPIAGTKPRFADKDTDEASQHELRTSSKERAEHLMLVDLIRNDLGRVAEPGSVQVTEFNTVETYSHVHHLVSEVIATRDPSKGLGDVIRAMFPGGTITGAPKISCMQQLVALEQEARGPYTGSLGFVDTNGDMDLNILIRTLIYRDGLVCFHGGGGIVADSHPKSEYLETRQKCLALMEALGIEC